MRDTRRAIVKRLEKDYRRKLGLYHVADFEIEQTFGREAVLAKITEIELKKAALRREIAGLEIAIRTYEPEWDRSQAKPMRPRAPPYVSTPIARATGEVLRDANRALTTREVSRAVASKLKLEFDETQVARIDKAVHAWMTKRLQARRAGARVYMHSDAPRRWSLKPPAGEPAGGA